MTDSTPTTMGNCRGKCKGSQLFELQEDRITWKCTVCGYTMILVTEWHRFEESPIVPINIDAETIEEIENEIRLLDPFESFFKKLDGDNKSK